MKKRNYKKILIAIVSIFSLVCLSSCDPIDGEAIRNKIFPNVWAFLAQILAFIVLVVLMIVLVYKPVKKFLNKRHEILDAEVKETFENNKKAKVNSLASEKNVAESKNKAKVILSSAEIEGNKKRDEIIENARKEAKDIIDNANKVAQRTKEDAKKDLKDQIVDTAMLASKQILKREIKEEDNTRIVDDFINELDNMKKKGK